MRTILAAVTTIALVGLASPAEAHWRDAYDDYYDYARTDVCANMKGVQTARMIDDGTYRYRTRTARGDDCRWGDLHPVRGGFS